MFYRRGARGHGERLCALCLLCGSIFLLLLSALSVFAQQKADKRAQLIAQETELLDKIKAAPSEAKLYNDLGVVRFYLGKSTEAESAFKRALEIDPNCIDAQANLSFYYFQTNREAAGEDLLRAALAADPNNFLANYFSGIFYYRRNQPTRAEIYLKKAAELQPKNIEARLDLIKLYRLQKKDAEAERSLDDLLTTAPEDARVRYARAVFYAETGRYREAVREYENVLLLNPEMEDVRFELALAAFYAKDWTACARALEQYQKSRSSVQSTYMLGACYMQLGRRDEAAAQFERAIEQKTDFFEARFELGRIRLDQQDANAAARQFEQALAAKADSIEARYLLGYCCELLGRFDQAKEQYEELIKRAPERFEGYHGLGSLAVRQGDPTALIHLKRALELGGRIADVYYLLGRAHARAGELETAVERFADAIKLEPSRPDAHYQLATVLKKMGREREAEFEFQTVEELNKKFRTGMATKGEK